MRPLDEASLRADSTSNPRSAALANVNRQADELAPGHEGSRAGTRCSLNTAAVQSRAALRAERSREPTPTTSPPDWKDRTCEH
jgi:hypothetical protein